MVAVEASRNTIFQALSAFLCHTGNAGVWESESGIFGHSSFEEDCEVVQSFFPLRNWHRPFF